jgi:hypothetical protein
VGFSFHSTGCVKRAKECWNESHTIHGSTPAKTKENPAEVNLSSSGCTQTYGVISPEVPLRQMKEAAN